jgi:hypothetical protein
MFDLWVQDVLCCMHPPSLDFSGWKAILQCCIYAASRLHSLMAWSHCGCTYSYREEKPADPFGIREGGQETANGVTETMD